MLESLAGRPPPRNRARVKTGKSFEIAPELQYFQTAVAFAATGDVFGKRKRIGLRQTRRERLFQDAVAGMRRMHWVGPFRLATLLLHAITAVVYRLFTQC